MLVAALLLFVAVEGFRIGAGAPAEVTLILLVVPIIACAIRLGLRGGLWAAFAATAIFSFDAIRSPDLEPLALVPHAIAFFLVGGFLGWNADRRHALATRLQRHSELSLDLFCTATFDGYFEHLNPAWEDVLGYRREELATRPFAEFVHPDDRAATEAEAAKLAGGGDSIRFRNRYRGADGTYRWLEWNATADAEEERIYATARDITVQRQAEEALQHRNDTLESTVARRTAALEEARLETLRRLAIIAEYRDDDTYQHTERVGRASALIARELGHDEESQSLIRRAAPLHDIGKVAISDAILLKPGRLTPAEFEGIKRHTEIGSQMLADAEFAVMVMAREIALSHHERWDGTGYPIGLYGEDIPESGRIVALADVFDALTHDRPYKRAWPVDEAVGEIESLSGEHFDPAVVEAFLRIDHPRLLEPIEDYDVDLPAPPLTTPWHPFRRSRTRRIPAPV